MNPTEQIACEAFIQETIQRARQMPISEARVYLHGFLILGDDQSQILEPIRSVYRAMCEVDFQLELISIGQIKFQFNEEGGK